MMYLDLGANIQDIQLSYDMLATDSKVPDVGPSLRCIMGYAQWSGWYQNQLILLLLWKQVRAVVYVSNLIGNIM